MLRNGHSIKRKVIAVKFKNARRVLVAGDVFENNWVATRKDFAIVLTVRTSGRL
jgi:hypothetical protein